MVDDIHSKFQKCRCASPPLFLHILAPINKMISQHVYMHIHIPLLFRIMGWVLKQKTPAAGDAQVSVVLVQVPSPGKLVCVASGMISGIKLVPN